MAIGNGQGSYWDDYKKYYTALYDSAMDRADVSGDGKAWDEAERRKKEALRIAQMGMLRDRVFNPQEVQLAASRLGINPIQVASNNYSEADIAGAKNYGITPEEYRRRIGADQAPVAPTPVSAPVEGFIDKVRNQAIRGFRNWNSGYYGGKVPEEFK